MKPRQKGKIVGFTISLTLFIIANFIQSSMNSKIKNINDEISKIEKNQEFHTKNMLLGEECFQKGQLYVTFSMMTIDENHPINMIYNPVAINFIGGLQFLNEILPEKDQTKWKEKIEKVSIGFKSLDHDAGINEFYELFNSGTLIFKELFDATQKYGDEMAEQKNRLRIKVNRYTYYSNLLQSLNMIILLFQLFFDKLFDLFLEIREEKQKAKLVSTSPSN